MPGLVLTADDTSAVSPQTKVAMVKLPESEEILGGGGGRKGPPTSWVFECLPHTRKWLLSHQHPQTQLRGDWQPCSSRSDEALTADSGSRSCSDATL